MSLCDIKFRSRCPTWPITSKTFTFLFFFFCQFSVENLMFWEAVEHYREAFDMSFPDENRRHAEAIAQQFLVDGALLQVR